ncbi:MAG: MurR/RpiR family transcriptional regulator [Ignavibacteriales bacterium]
MVSRYKDLQEKIQSRYEKLPANQRKVADYIIENFDSIPFLDVHELAKHTNVSVASVIRFSQSIGLAGFSELRNEISNSLKQHLKKNLVFPLLDKTKLQDDILTSIANVDVKNINDTLAKIDRDTFNKVIEQIVGSKRVFTAGLGISFLLSEILAYQLTQVGIDASVFKHTHTLFHEQVMYLKKDDTLITFSFPPYSKETVELAKYANQKKIFLISITNKPTAPVALFSKYALIVKSENLLFTNSFAAISVLINAIATSCAMKNKSLAERVLKESEKIMLQYDQIII